MDEGYGHSIGMSKRPIDAVRYKNIPGKAHEPLSLQLWSGRPFAFETPACVHCRERTEAPTLGRLEWFFHSWHNMVFKNVYLLIVYSNDLDCVLWCLVMRALWMVF